MSHKLPPDELYRIIEATAPEHSVEKLVLLDHIAAVKTERDEAAALLWEFRERNPYAVETSDQCIWCDAYEWEPHRPDCLKERIRAWLAKVEGDVEGGT
jgi:hypothetical protein